MNNTMETLDAIEAKIKLRLEVAADMTQGEWKVCTFTDADGNFDILSESGDCSEFIADSPFLNDATGICLFVNEGRPGLEADLERVAEIKSDLSSYAAAATLGDPSAAANVARAKSQVELNRLARQYGVASEVKE